MESFGIEQPFNAEHGVSNIGQHFKASNIGQHFKAEQLPEFNAEHHTGSTDMSSELQISVFPVVCGRLETNLQ